LTASEPTFPGPRVASSGFVPELARSCWYLVHPLFTQVRRKRSVSLPALAIARTRSRLPPRLPVAGTVIVTGAPQVSAALVGSTAAPAASSAASSGSKAGLVGRWFFTCTAVTIPAEHPGTSVPAKHSSTLNAHWPLRVPSASHAGSPSKQRTSRRRAVGGGG
jgi:hypothetical protein